MSQFRQEVRDTGKYRRINLAMELKNFVIVSEWWAEQLRDTEPLQDNGTESLDRFNALTGLMGWRSPLPSLPEEKIWMFKKALLGAIARDKPTHISVDYDPDEYLQEAADFAKITDIRSRLPIKTITWVDKLLVRKGYNGEPLSILDQLPSDPPNTTNEISDRSSFLATTSE